MRTAWSLGLVLILAALPARAEEVNVFSGMVPANWLTEDGVNIENLKYTNTHLVLLFYAQDKDTG